MNTNNPILLMAAQLVAPNSLAAYMAEVKLRMQAATTASVQHEAKLAAVVNEE